MPIIEVQVPILEAQLPSRRNTELPIPRSPVPQKFESFPQFTSDVDFDSDEDSIVVPCVLQTGKDCLDYLQAMMYTRSESWTFKDIQEATRARAERNTCKGKSSEYVEVSSDIIHQGESAVSRRMAMKKNVKAD